jgi:hypothetical protein
MPLLLQPTFGLVLIITFVLINALIDLFVNSFSNPCSEGLHNSLHHRRAAIPFVDNSCLTYPKTVHQGYLVVMYTQFIFALLFSNLSRELHHRIMLMLRWSKLERVPFNSCCQDAVFWMEHGYLVKLPFEHDKSCLQ